MTVKFIYYLAETIHLIVVNIQSLDVGMMRGYYYV